MMANTVAKLLYECSITKFCSVVNNFVVSSSLASNFYQVVSVDLSHLQSILICLKQNRLVLPKSYLFLFDLSPPTIPVISFEVKAGS